MAILICDSIKQFMEIGESCNSDRFRMFLTSDNKAIIRPTVSTHSLETLVIENLSSTARDDLVEWWKDKCGKVFEIQEFIWREDRLI